MTCKNYAFIPDLKEVFVIQQNKPYIQHYFRDDKGEMAIRNVIEGEAVELYIKSLNISLPLSEIYKDVFDQI